MCHSIFLLLRTVRSTGKDETLRIWDLVSARCALTTKLAAPASLCCWSPLGVRYALVSLMRVEVRSLAGGGGGGGEAGGASVQLQQESPILCCVFLSEAIVATGGADGVVCSFFLIRQPTLHAAFHLLDDAMPLSALNGW